MSYVIKVDGMKVKSCAHCHNAKKIAKKRKGKVYGYVKAKMPKASMLSYNSPESLKREIYREVYSENNHGYYIARNWSHDG